MKTFCFTLFLLFSLTVSFAQQEVRHAPGERKLQITRTAAGLIERTAAIGSATLNRQTGNRMLSSGLLPVYRSETVAINGAVSYAGKKVLPRIAKGLGITALSYFAGRKVQNSNLKQPGKPAKVLLPAIGLGLAISAKDLAGIKGRPKAYLQYSLYNKDTVWVSGGIQPLNKGAKNKFKDIAIDVKVAADGFLRVAYINESNRDVWVNDLHLVVKGDSALSSGSFQGQIANVMNLQNTGICLPEYECDICDPTSGCYEECYCYPELCDPCYMQPTCECDEFYCDPEGEDPCDINPFNCDCDVYAGSNECECYNNCGEPPTPVYDCAGVANGSAYWDNCNTCVGGTTGLAPCIGPKPSKNPCEQKKFLDYISKNVKVAAGNNKIVDSLITGNEFATEEVLLDWTSSSPVYKDRDVRTNNSPDSVSSLFSWNATDGYTVGFTHNHPDSTPPSLVDIFSLIEYYNESDLQNAGPEAVNFFKDNARLTLITHQETYALSVKDWDLFYHVYNEYQLDPAGFRNVLFQRADDLGSYEKALLEKFGTSMNFFKAFEDDRQVFYPYTLVGTEFVGISCP